MEKLNYSLRRGGRSIELIKEKSVFTTVLKSEKELEELKSKKVIPQKVFGNVYKVKATGRRQENLMKFIRNSPHPGTAHHAYVPANSLDKTRYYLTDQVFITFQEGTVIDVIENILYSSGLKFLKKFEATNSENETTVLAEVTSSAGKNPIKVCNDLVKLPIITNAEPNLVNRFERSYTPKDSLFRRQWHLASQRDIELSENASVNAPEAWDITKGDRSVVIAVVDDGFDLTHPDFSGKGKIVHAKDFVDGDFEPFPCAHTNDYHGTPCAGVACAEETGTGTVGVAPGCALMPIRFPISADDHLLYEIFEYTGQYADVISCSWGPVPVFAPISSLLQEQMTRLTESGGPRKKGCVILFAAGNYNAPVTFEKNKKFIWSHPSAGLVETSGHIYNGHAAHPDVMAIAAVTSQNRKSAYSNWGKEISVCAPSSNGHPIDKSKRLPGRGIWTTDNDKQGLGFTYNSRYTNNFGGTSSACPLVAGIAGLVISANKELTAKEVRLIIEATADRIEDHTPCCVLGNKHGYYDKTGHSQWFGYGKVNAAAAVKAAVDRSGDTQQTLEQANNSINEGDIKIVGLIPNPKGRDRGEEVIYLENKSARDIPTKSLYLINQVGEIQPLFEVAPNLLKIGDRLKIELQSMKLHNKGGTIRLFTNNQRVIDTATYTENDVSEGVTILL